MLNKLKEEGIGKFTSKQIFNMSRKDVGNIGVMGFVEGLLELMMFES